MRSPRKTGVVLIYVLGLLAVAGVLTAVLAAATAGLRRDTDRMTSMAHRTNLRASAAAWARLHGDAATTTLDTAALDIPGSAITVTVAPNGAAAIELSYRCPMRRRVLHVGSDGSISAEPTENE